MKRKISALMLAVFLLGLSLPLSLAAEPSDLQGSTVHIRSIADLQELSRLCVLDTWSRGKTVILDSDLNLSGLDISPIPVFCGTFDGQEHTISGLKFTDSGSMRGLFRVIEQGGTVQDLNVTGTFAPSGQKDSIGGITGRNSGSILRCTFSGTIHGDTSIGGIAGVNTATGQIINCTFSGTLTGEHEAGGIAGTNQGSLVQCSNEGSINTTEVKADVSLTDLNLEHINTSQNLPAATDIGGIVGLSTGVVENCENSGDVGYAHTGYNIGGIAGRQSGSLGGCTNSGTILGRKDIGGIVGQLEPQITLQYTQSDLNQLWQELENLQSLMDGAISSASSHSQDLTSQVDAMTGHIAETRDAVSSLADGLSGWADSGMDQLEDLSGRISWTLRQAGPILDQVEQAGDGLQTSVSHLTSALKEARATGDLAGEAADALQKAVEDLQTALEEGKTAIHRVTSGLESLKNGLGSMENMRDALNEIGDSVSGLGSCVSRAADAIAAMKNALASLPEIVQNQEAGQKLTASLEDLHGALVEIASAQAEIHTALSTLASAQELQGGLQALSNAVAHLADASADLDQAHRDFDQAVAALQNRKPITALADLRAGLDDLKLAIDDLKSASADFDTARQNLVSATVQGRLKDLQAGLDHLSTAFQHAQTALTASRTALDALLKSPEWQSSMTDLKAGLDALAPILDSAGQAIQGIGSATDSLASNLDPDQIESALSELHSTSDSLDGIMDRLSDSMSHVMDAMDLLSQTGDSGSVVLGLLADASEGLQPSVQSIRQAVTSLREVIQELADQPSIVVDSITDTLSGQRDTLDSTFSQLLQDMEDLNSTVSASSGSLFADLTAVNRQMDVIVGILRNGSQTDPMEEDHFVDISDLETGDQNGHITTSSNTGLVDGDVNVAGITGSMAMEYDFDPEDDLTRNGERSLDFRYQARAVVRSCTNEGEIRVKNDCGGGITGRMDLGSITGCESYGSVSSTGGDYVGGIAGSSTGVIRESWVRCPLSGQNWIGGVAGSGATITDCHTLIEIDQGEAFLGTIAGDLEEGGSCTGNTYVHDSLGGVDGLSYSGACDPVSFDDLAAMATVPEQYLQFRLTLVADGEVVDEIPFHYGDSLDSLPPVPEKDGCTGTWPEIDLDHLTFSRTLEATYTFFKSAISDGGDPPQVLAEATFSSDATLHADIQDQTWTDRNGGSHAGSVCTVSLEDPHADSIGACTLHWHLQNKKAPDTIWLQAEDGWQRVETTQDGSYLLFPASGAQITFAAEPAAPSPFLWILPALGALALLVLLVLLVRLIRARRARKAARAASDADTGDASDPTSSRTDDSNPHKD